MTKGNVEQSVSNNFESVKNELDSEEETDSRVQRLGRASYQRRDKPARLRAKRWKKQKR